MRGNVQLRSFLQEHLDEDEDEAEDEETRGEEREPEEEARALCPVLPEVSGSLEQSHRTGNVPRYFNERRSRGGGHGVKERETTSLPVAAQRRATRYVDSAWRPERSNVSPTVTPAWPRSW